MATLRFLQFRFGILLVVVLIAPNCYRVAEFMASKIEQDFKIKFNGEPNSIDAETLGHSLVNITSIIKEVNDGLKIGAPIEIKVKAHGEGSFVVHLALLPAEIGQLLTPEVLKTAGAGIGVIITTLAGVFKIRKLLKGKPPKEIQQGANGITIIGDNARLIVDRSTYETYFGNPKVSEALSKTFKTLESDPQVAGFEILDEQEQPLFDAMREDFSPMALKGDLPLPETRAIVQGAYLHIVKPSFERGLKWEIVFNGNRISVAMNDEAFLESIDKGERFAQGDGLDVVLGIEQVFDPNIRTYLNKSYRVEKVIRHIPRTVQARLAFDEVDPERLARLSKEEPERIWREAPAFPDVLGALTSGDRSYTAGKEPTDEEDDEFSKS
jgi:hypothetical protein